MLLNSSHILKMLSANVKHLEFPNSKETCELTMGGIYIISKIKLNPTENNF